MADIVTASDELHRVVADAWKANAETIYGAPVTIRYTIKHGAKPPTNADGSLWAGAWLRVTVLDQDADTYALGAAYRTVGTLYCNVFVPTKETAGRCAQTLAEMLANAMRSHTEAGTGHVRLSRVRPQFVSAANGDFAQYNVLADFEWFQHRGN